jgi:hypothetical protein
VKPIHLKLLGLSPVPLVLLGVFLYPPLRADDSWTMAEPLPSPMGEIMGTVVAGKWYVMAGLDTKTNKPLSAVYVFDPANNAWTARKAMPVAVHHIMTAALNGKIYVFGGFVSPPNVAAWKPTDHASV